MPKKRRAELVFVSKEGENKATVSIVESKLSRLKNTSKVKVFDPESDIVVKRLKERLSGLKVST